MINTEGRILYSFNKEIDYGTSLLTGDQNSNPVQEVFQKALKAGKTGDPDKVFMVDYRPYTPYYETPSSFSASPVMRGNTCIGVSVMKMPLYQLATVMSNDAGLGEKGDSYLVGGDYLMRSDSHQVKDLTAIHSFRKNHQIRNEVIDAVLAGKTVAKAFKNLSGNDALVAAKPVSVGHYTWALIDEIEMEEAMALVNELQSSMGILSFISAVSVIIISLLVSSSIVKPVRNMVKRLQEIASGEGDLTKRLSIKTRDEVGEASQAFNTFMNKLNKIIVSLAENAKKLGEASEYLGTSSSDMAETAIGMDRQVANVAAAGEELSDNIQSMSQGAEQISASTQGVSNAIEDLRNSIVEVAETCNEGSQIAQEANKKTQNTSSDIHELGKVAQQIEGVVDLIRNVADQTNLLALNASIEAANAGEAGQGFSVVANEVKELAHKTTEATHEIETKIGQIRSRIGGSIESITEVAEVIKKINEISGDISKSMQRQSSTTNEISNAVKEVSDSSSLLAKNVEESAGGANEIAKNITGVSKATKVSKQGASGTNGQSKKIAKTTDILNNIVGQFRY